jgi:hypothetical protein
VLARTVLQGVGDVDLALGDASSAHVGRASTAATLEMAVPLPGSPWVEEESAAVRGPTSPDRGSSGFPFFVPGRTGMGC